MNRRSALSNRTLATIIVRLKFKSGLTDSLASRTRWPHVLICLTDSLASRPHLPHGLIGLTDLQTHRSGQYLSYVGVEFQRNLGTLIFHAACAQVGVAT